MTTRRLALLLTVAWTTVPGVSRAFRTTADIPGFAGSAARWPSSQVGFSIFTDTYPSTVGREQAAAWVAQGFASWSGPACTDVEPGYGGLTYARALPSDQRNTVEWVTFGWTARGFSASQGAVTDIEYLGVDGVFTIVEADIYLNADDFSWGPGAELDPANVITHEAGHWLGVSHSCEPDGRDGAPLCGAEHEPTLMHPIYSSTRREISPDDEAAICFLYPASPCSVTGCGPGEICVGEECLVACGTGSCVVGEVCLDGACVEASRVCGVRLCSDTQCTDDTDCGAALSCEGGECVRGVGLRGDPCDSARDCQEAACSTEGYCSSVCESDASCGEGSACVEGACTLSKSGFGTSCEDGADCASGRCLAGASPEPMCTRDCTGPCPEGWDCTPVGEARVCVPPPPERAEEGCAMSPPLRGACYHGWGAAILIGLIAGFRARYRRRMS